MQKKRFLLLAMLTLSSFTYAADFKLAYVDVAKIFTTSKPAIAMRDALSAKFAPQQQELQKLNSTLVAEQNQMQAIMKKASSMDSLSPPDRASLERMEGKYQKDQMVFQQKYMASQQQVQKTQDYASALVLGKVNTILKDISDKGGYDLVLTSNQLVYAKPKYDLTDQVIEQLNKVSGSDLVKQLEAAEKQAAANNTQSLATPLPQGLPSAPVTK